MAEPCDITISSSPPAADWRAFLDTRPDATIFHDPAWGGVMRVVYRSRAHYLTARRGRCVVGLLQLIGQPGLLSGSHLCSVPYADASGVLADDASVRSALMARAGELMGRTGADWVELRQAEALPGIPAGRTDKVTFRLDLPGEPDALWKRLNAKVRNQVRKAERADLAAGQGGGELLSEFHAIYTRNMRDLGSPPHSRRFFRAFLDAFGDRVRLFVVRLGGAAIAASFVLSDGRGVHVPWAAADWRHRQLCANMLLYWEMLADSCRRGASCFDFGRCTRDSGTYQFKKQWGATEIPLYWHYLLADGQAVPDLRPDSARFRWMVACWQRLPVSIARGLGPHIIARLS